MAERWEDVAPLVPARLRPYLVEESWSHDALWRLELPVDTLPVAKLAWQLELPWWRHGERVFAISPAEVLREPTRDPAQFDRILAADLAYPIDLTLRRGRLIVLDGVHRLAKAMLLGLTEVKARRVPAVALPLIAVQ